MRKARLFGLAMLFSHFERMQHISGKRELEGEATEWYLGRVQTLALSCAESSFQPKLPSIFEVQYIMKNREKLGGYLPLRTPAKAGWNVSIAAYCSLRHSGFLDYT